MTLRAAAPNLVVPADVRLRARVLVAASCGGHGRPLGVMLRRVRCWSGLEEGLEIETSAEPRPAQR